MKGRRDIPGATARRKQRRIRGGSEEEEDGARDGQSPDVSSLVECPSMRYAASARYTHTSGAFIRGAMLSEPEWGAAQIQFADRLESWLALEQCDCVEGDP